MYCIGKFPEEDNAVEVFPKKWLDGNTCFWPNKANQAGKYARKQKNPDPTKWQAHPVIVLKEYESYEEAINQLELATVTSDLESGGSQPEKVIETLPLPGAPSSSGVPIPVTLLHSAEDSGTCADPNLSSTYVAPILTTDNIASLGEIVLNLNEEISSVSQSCCNKHEGLILEMGRDIAKLTTQVKELTEILGQVLNHVVNLVSNNTDTERTKADVPPLTGVITLPIVIKDDLTKLNNFVANDTGKLSLKQYLNGTGGMNLENAIQRTMEKLIADNVMVTLSLKGKRGKGNFRSEYSDLYTSILDAVRAFPSLTLIVQTGQADDKHYSDAMASAFKKACDRVYSQKRREAAEQRADLTGP